MPSTRSQSHAQPTLAFPCRKSCRVSSRSKTTPVTQPPVRSPAKPDPPFPTQTIPLSPRHPTHRLSPLSPRHPAAPPPSPNLQPRLPLSPRKRTGERTSGSLSPVYTSKLEFTLVLRLFVSTGDDSGCNLSHSLLGSPPKQSKPSLASPRKLGFDENSPVSAHRQLVPPPRSPARSSPRRQETPSKGPEPPVKGKLLYPPTVF